MSYRCIGTNKLENCVLQGLSYCKYIDADGNLVVGEGIRTGKEGTKIHSNICYQSDTIGASVLLRWP